MSDVKPPHGPHRPLQHRLRRTSTSAMYTILGRPANSPTGRAAASPVCASHTCSLCAETWLFAALHGRVARCKPWRQRTLAEIGGGFCSRAAALRFAPASAVTASMRRGHETWPARDAGTPPPHAVRCVAGARHRVGGWRGADACGLSCDPRSMPRTRSATCIWPTLYTTTRPACLSDHSNLVNLQLQLGASPLPSTLPQ